MIITSIKNKNTRYVLTIKYFFYLTVVFRNQAVFWNQGGSRASGRSIGFWRVVRFDPRIHQGLSVDNLSPFDKSWKTYPIILLKFQFSGRLLRTIFGKLIQYFFRNFMTHRSIHGKFIHANSVLYETQLGYCQYRIE